MNAKRNSGDDESPRKAGSHPRTFSARDAGEGELTVLDRLDRIEMLIEAGISREAYTVAQVAARLGYTRWTIRQACNEGRIKAEKAKNGRGWRISRAELIRVEADGF